jgi:hypothetical protein
MSREVDLLAKELQKVPATVMRTEVNLYQSSSIQSASAAFLRRVEQEAKREKTATVTLVAVIKST